MLKQRLSLGTVLILAIAGMALVDQWLEGRPAGWWPGRETVPPAVLLVPVVMLLGAMGGREVARILRAKGVEIQTTPAVLAALLGVSVMSFGAEGMTGVAGLGLGAGAAVLSWALGLLYSVRNRTTSGAVAVAGAVLLVHVYMGLMPGFLVLIRREHPIWVLVWVLACVKFCDIGAYFTGTTIGRNKMIPWLSPGKTWEGLAGGLITAGAAGAVGAWWMGRTGISGVGVAAGAAMGALFGAFGQLGDLAASLFKRDAGVKDSGSSMPGFGGVLDLIDSPVLVAPLAFWLLHALAV
ncbi:MAG: phosphatidate cytidylyltransferase [Planctomycetes bacterium]|nr:phosphatidate cytidylyltransferase [Planctomycetota bacterium]